MDEATIYTIILTCGLSDLQQRAVLGMYRFYKSSLGVTAQEAYTKTLSDFHQVAYAIYLQLQQGEKTYAPAAFLSIV